VAILVEVAVAEQELEMPSQLLDRFAQSIGSIALGLRRRSRRNRRGVGVHHAVALPGNVSASIMPLQGID
jgi:hypothetical protein